MHIYSKNLLHLKPTYELVIAKVLFALGYAVAIVGVPLFLLEIGLRDSQIGIFMGSVSLLIAALSLFMPIVLERFNQRKLLIVSAISAGVGFMLFGLTDSSYLAATLLFIVQTALHINASALSVLFKDSTRSEAEFTRDLGLLGSFGNFGWFIGPLIGGLILGTYGFEGLFLLAGSFLVIGGLYVLLFPFKTVVKERMVFDRDLKENIKFYISKPQLRIAYLQCLGIGLWWGFVWTFMPVLMLQRGYSDASIGLYISATQLPLFLFEFKTVGLVKKYGFRRIFALCYTSLAAICVLSFIVFSSFLPVALFLVFLGSLALSFLEPISDLFFFNKVSLLEEEKTYPTYATSAPFGSVISKLMLGAALTVLHDKAIFLIVAVLTGYIAYRALSITARSVPD